jgi:hypothetical protein
MRRLILPAVFWVFAVLALASGIALVILGKWHQPLMQAEEDARAGKLEEALSGFARSEAELNQATPVKRFLPAGQAVSVSNQLALLYRLRRHDELLEKAATSPSVPATHFWAGCALFEKGRVEEESEARVGWLSRAEQEFQQALELDPGDWDTKYNYELTKRLLSELRKDPKTPPKQLLQLLRPQPKDGGPPAKRIG